MATSKRPALRKNDRVTLSRIKRSIPAYDGKPFVGRDMVLTVSHITGTGTKRNPWGAVVTDGTHFWHLEPGDIAPAEEQISVCTGCRQPAHASETDDAGYHPGCAPTSSNVVPARLVLTDPHNIGNSMHSRKKVESDLNTWLDSHGYRHSTRGTSHSRIIHQPPTGHPVFAAHERDHHITTSGRRALDRGQFALPPSSEEKRRGIKGRLPIDTIERARNALQRASQMQKRGHLAAGQLAEVRRVVHKAWPSIESKLAHAVMHTASENDSPAVGYSKFHVRPHGYPISFRKEIHGQYEILRRPSDFLVKYAAAIGNIGAIEPIETFGKYPSVEQALEVIDRHNAEQRCLGKGTSSHATIAKGGPSNVRLGDKFRHEGGIWQVIRISGNKITTTSEVADPRDPFNLEKFVLIERTWPQAALRKMVKMPRGA